MALDGKTGVMLVNLGTPDSPSRKDVYKYLKQFLLDERVIDIPTIPRNLLVRGIIVPFRSGSSSKLYKELWTENGSPLKYYGEALEKGVQEELGDSFFVRLAMRYQNPSIQSIVDEMMQEGVKEIVVFSMFPQYASATTGSVFEEVMRVVSQKQNIVPLKFVEAFYDCDSMIDIFVENAHKYDLDSYDHVIFSYHGLPERQIRKADDFNHCLKEGCCDTMSKENRHCYMAQCYATTRALVKKLGFSDDFYSTSFQSRLGKDPWIQPYTSDIIEQLAKEGKKRLLVFCPAFVADCLETTIEIGVEYQEEFEEKGGEHIDLVESLNDNPKWIQAVADLVRKK